MAGGMRKGRVGPSMSERVARTYGGDDACPARHCWVAGAADGQGVKRPGLLVEWRQGVGGGWEGRVVYVAQLRDGRWAVVEEWVGAALLSAT